MCTTRVLKLAATAAGALAWWAATAPAAPPATPRPGVYRYDLLDGKAVRLGGGYNPCWSGDGRKVYFTANATDRGAIYVVNRNGTGRRRFARSEGPYELALCSADDRYVVALGLDLERSSKDAFPAFPVAMTTFTPEGKVVRGPALVVFEFEQYQPLGSVLAWSPTGHRLAVTPNLPDSRVPYVLDVATGRRTKLAGLDPATKQATWQVLDQKTGDVRQFLMQNAWCPAWSGDGRWVAFSAGDSVVFAGPSGGGQVRRLPLRTQYLAGVPQLGEFVAFVETEDPVEIQRFTPDGRITARWDVPAGLWLGGLSASRTRVAWHSQGALGNGLGPCGLGLGLPGGRTVRAVDYAERREDTPNGEMFLSQSEPPRWSPDGLSVVFGTDREW